MFLPTFSSTAAVLLAATLADAHTVITYPGWRGDTIGFNDSFPYGMQFAYPCGGISAATNRTDWPLTGGALAIQPGWFAGHEQALIYINIGIGTSGPFSGPPNMSIPLLPPFQINGPTNSAYPGTFCLPHVPVPQDRGLKAGDLATLQVLEITKHGAALFNCVDITFTTSVPAPNATTCFNSSSITFSAPFTGTKVTTFSDSDPNVNTSTNSSTTSGTSSGGSNESGSGNGTEGGSGANGECPVCPPTPTPSSCPATNGGPGVRDEMGAGVGFGFGLGVAVGGVVRVVSESELRRR